ncbi:hypothetical protein QAD02_022006 [Eretmocerus hayati]|uniref:Uncharacterized protein n=1 Tax=Eretmocerus hayati TaxID=131215 RepID=A0ACC2PS25_9HYME|nr:hypothetical protein QAD02_022006 [Eretmocerus hayati]
MAGPMKKRELQSNIENEHEDDEENMEDSGDEAPDAIKNKGMEITVDFEGRSPQDPDHPGIKTLLQQLFLKSHVNLSDLTDLIISQNYVGSVIKQSLDDAASDDEDDNVDDVFGITTVINISERQNTPECVKELRTLLKHLISEHATDSTKTLIENVLEKDSASLGLLINERFVNIPPLISVPLLENLASEIKRAISKNMAFNFTHLLLICKLYKTSEDNQKKKGKRKSNTEESNLLWSNPEEELFADEAICSFEFSVEKQTDNGLSGSWTEDDFEMVPYRKVMLFESSKLEQMIDKIKTQI